MSTARPYPFEKLPRLRRADVRTLRDVVHALPLKAPAAILEATRNILGQEPRLEPAAPSFIGPGALAQALADPLLAVCIEGVGGHRSALAVEFDPSLGLSLVDRALGGPGGPVAGVAASPMDDARRGVLAYVAAELLAASRTHARVGAVVTTRAALTAILGDDGVCLWPLKLTLGDERAALRIWMPVASLSPDVATEPLRAGLAQLELRGSVVVGEARLPLSEVRGLGLGDVILLDAMTIDRATYAGTASLRFGLGGAWRARCQLGDGVLTFDSFDLDPSRGIAQGRIMTDTETTDTHEDASLSMDDTLRSLSDAPIELTLELARCSLSLGELSALRPGEVVLGGQPVGASITLRAGDRAIGRGELVDVEGEIGIRLTEVAGSL